MAHDCPSARCAPGARAFGAVGSDGRVKHFRTTLPVDADFTARANRHSDAESRMRFASPCAESGCGNWKNGECSLIGRVHDFLDSLDSPPPAPPDTPSPCPIRGTCRWFAQERFRACAVCDLVVRRPA